MRRTRRTRRLKPLRTLQTRCDELSKIWVGKMATLGPELDFEVQLRLRGCEVPRLQIDRDAEVGPRLGWNTWLCAKPPHRDAEDAVFAGEACRRV